MTYNTFNKIIPIDYGADRYYKDGNIAVLEKQLEKQIQKSKDEKANTILSLSNSSLDAEILSLLDKQPMTLKEIVCAFDISEYPQSIFQQRMEDLVQEGYIDDIATGILEKIVGKISPQIHKKRISTLMSKDQTYFTLTSKGFFKQHPLVVDNALKK